MNRTIATIMITALLLAGCSSGVSQEKYDAVASERDTAIEAQSSAEEKLADAERIIDEKTNKISGLESQIEAMQQKPPAVPDNTGEEEPSQPDTSIAEAAPSVTAKPTMGQKNALEKAKQYLNFMAFSHKGLVDQLVFEGFSNEEAAYGADNCGADWNYQADQKAESYLDFSAFSRSGLIDQLIFDGFTSEQAEYGADQNGY